MPTKEDILESIANMTVLELSELLKEFEEKFGVTAAAPVAVAAAAPAGGGGGAAQLQRGLREVEDRGARQVGGRRQRRCR